MKNSRHFAIRDILSHQRITTQEELAEALKERGHKATQATVSRDFKELCLIKIPDGAGYRYAFPDNNPRSSHERIKRVFQDSVISYDFSENIIVIKTLPGAAQSIASLIDSMDNAHILGTVAGDDTIFIVIKPIDAVAEVLDAFRKIIIS